MKLSKIIFLLAALILTLTSSLAECEEQNDVVEWQILTEHNFSSQIQLHPHFLLIVTVPWSGESRSLMKELSRLVTERQDDFSSLKLMIMYRNSEKMLAGAIGAAEEGVTVLYYHHSVAYRYRGKLRAASILFSVYPYMTISPDELPLKELSSLEELKDFVESTDKALILFEFCGWTRKLLAKGKNNVTENGISLQGNHSGLGFDRGTYGAQISKRKDHKKGMENGEMMCGIENGFSGIPWIGQFSLLNDSDTQGADNVMSGVGLSCNFEEFEHFESFFSKFVNVVREFFLPRERHRFGLVSERSILQCLGVEDSDSWLAMLNFAGCPSCSKILKEGNDLKNVLQMDDGIVVELDGDGQDLDVLPANKPSILLFVDRLSYSSETRRKSKEALINFRELAQHYLIPHQVDWQANDQPGRPSVQANQVLRSTSGHPRLKLSPVGQKFKFNDKMSVMVLDEGKHVSLDSIATDFQGNSLQEILEYLLQKNKGAKLSSVAKEVGFRLLSDDFDIKIADALSSSHTELQPNQVSSTPSEEGIRINVGLDKDQSTHGASISAVEQENSISLDISSLDDISSHHDEEHIVSVDTKEHLISEESDHFPGHDLATAKDEKVEEKIASQIYMLGEPQLEFQGFRGSFFFCDGNFRLLRALTGGSAIPSLAIVDPISVQHYVPSEEITFSYSSMADFLHGFLNGSFLPYQLSESIPQSSRDAIHPPFVNMDFHEADSIPRVTIHSFSELVFGRNQSDDENAFSAWNEDVVVLFSSSWCGFCQRMELVVREVFRAIIGYMKSLKNGYKTGQKDLHGEDLESINLNFPRIYLMDCTLNDCSLILKSTTQREVYPALILFPAERKNAIPYQGDIAVADVIKFIADHGNKSRDLNENGIIWTLPEKEGRHQNLFEDSSPPTGHKEAPDIKESFHEIILKSETPKAADKDSWTKSHTSKRLHETSHDVVAGSVLVAADKLAGVHPFENSKVLIVKADQSIGFHGVIINKHIGWETLREVDKGLEFLKEAPLSLGGPLIKRGMPLVSLSRGVTKNQYPEIIPGVYFLDQTATVNVIEELKSGNLSITDYWFFLGFSNWGWDQLFHEIAAGAWRTGEGSPWHLDWPSSSMSLEA